MKIKNTLLALACGSILGNVVQAQQHELKLSDLDQDSNTMLSLKEWDAMIEEHGIFEKLDDNNNAIFDLEESVNNFIDYDLSMDLDDGGHIERQEFTVGLFNRLDKNQDDSLDNNEFMEFNNKLKNSDLLTER